MKWPTVVLTVLVLCNQIPELEKLINFSNELTKHVPLKVEELKIELSLK